MSASRMDATGEPIPPVALAQVDAATSMAQQVQRRDGWTTWNALCDRMRVTFRAAFPTSQHRDM